MAKKNGTKKATIGIAIAGAVAAALFYFMGKRGEPPPPPTYICPYCGESFSTAEELAAHILAEHGVEPPPVEQFGRLIGRVVDGKTYAGITGAKIYIDGKIDCYSYSDGLYQSNYYTYGKHIVKVLANNYYDGNFEVDFFQPTNEVDLELLPLVGPPPPPNGNGGWEGWTKGVTVRQVTVEPPVLYLGDSVHITVYINYPAPIPETVHATISVDGTKLSGDFPTTYAKVDFTYTPIVVGEYTVIAQDKSAHFTVLQDVVSAYYSPFGGTRMPLCTKIVIPDVNPYQNNPGGNVEVSGLSSFIIPDWIHRAGSDQQLYLATGIEWTPETAVVNGHVISVDFGYKDFVTVMATNYTCPEYWSSKEELAQMIGTKRSISVPNEWKIQYGTTCSNCGGTGQVWVEKRRRYDTCPTCGGLGRMFVIDLAKGIRDWVKSMEIGTNPPVYAGIVYYNFTIVCPYCGTLIEHNHEDGRVVLARELLNHIEVRHPSHPLTEPAWF